MYRRETSQLHAIVASPNFRLVLTRHAEEQMACRRVARFEVERVLKAGVVVGIETDPDGRERWRVTGHDTDGRRIEPVVEVRLPKMLRLVTLIRVG